MEIKNIIKHWIIYILSILIVLGLMFFFFKYRYFFNILLLYFGIIIMCAILFFCSISEKKSILGNIVLFISCIVYLVYFQRLISAMIIVNTFSGYHIGILKMILSMEIVLLIANATGYDIFLLIKQKI